MHDSSRVFIKKHKEKNSLSYKKGWYLCCYQCMEIVPWRQITLYDHTIDRIF